MQDGSTAFRVVPNLEDSQRDIAVRSRKLVFASYAWAVCVRRMRGVIPAGRPSLPSSLLRPRHREHPFPPRACRPRAKPKFGSPPKSQMAPPADSSS